MLRKFPFGQKSWPPVTFDPWCIKFLWRHTAPHEGPRFGAGPQRVSISIVYSLIIMTIDTSHTWGILRHAIAKKPTSFGLKLSDAVKKHLEALEIQVMERREWQQVRGEHKSEWRFSPQVNYKINWTMQKNWKMSHSPLFAEPALVCVWQV